MKRIITLAVVTLLTACSSQLSFPVKSPERAISKALYLRGEFSLWDAQPEYLFKQETEGGFVSKIYFAKAGVAYEFKIADEEWSPGYNCGYLDQGKGGKLLLGQSMAADCESIYNYFSFTPANKGWYQVRINFPVFGEPEVRIDRMLER